MSQTHNPYRDAASKKSLWAIAATVAVLAGVLLAAGWESEPASPTAVRLDPPGSLVLVFAYSSEKEKCIEEVTAAFNQADYRISSGERISVQAIPMASGEAINEALDGRRQPHLISPASTVFVELGNAQSESKFGQVLFRQAANLVRTPLVIAMWKPMADSLGWSRKPIGWSDILALARSERGWEAFGQPQWGPFKFGQTRPKFSSSGLLTILAELHALSGKNRNLTATGVPKPQLVNALASIERTVTYEGSSTGFYGRLMFLSDPKTLSAAALYENMVIESYSQGNIASPIVAIYPKEGTLWSDHPIGIVERDWVTGKHRAAARVYIDYLLARPQQEKAIAYGFRPGSPDVPLGAPIDARHGADPNEPRTTLESPSLPVVQGILDLWQNEGDSHPEI